MAENKPNSSFWLDLVVFGMGIGLVLMAWLKPRTPQPAQAPGFAAIDANPLAENEGHTNPTVSYERSDADPRGVSASIIGVLAGTLIIFGLMWFWFTILSNYRTEVTPRRLPLASQLSQVPPEPRLQLSPEEDLKHFREGEQKLLDGYSWIDREKGIVSIPVDRAMNIVAQRGLPKAKLPAGVVLSQPAEGTQQTGFEGKVLAPPQ